MKYHPYCIRILTRGRETGQGTMPGGQFDWGGYLELVGSMAGDCHTQIQLYAGTAVPLMDEVSVNTACRTGKNFTMRPISREVIIDPSTTIR